MDNLEEAFEEYWDRMREAGALEIDSIDDDGEIVYAFNMEIMKAQFPEMWQAHLDDIDQSMLELAEKGLVNIDFTNEDVGFVLTEKGQQYIDIINQT